MDVTERNLDAGITIRPAEGRDFDAILQVWHESDLSIRPTGRDRREAFLKQLERYPSLYLVATDETRIIGTVLGTHDHRKGWINRLAIAPAFRRRGIASALVRACETALREQGIEIVAALVEPWNQSSAMLFESLGYAADVPVRYYRKLARPDI